MKELLSKAVIEALPHTQVSLQEKATVRTLKSHFSPKKQSM